MDYISKSSETIGDTNMTILGKSNDIYTNLWFKGSSAAVLEACMDKLYVNTINDLPFPPPSSTGGEYPMLVYDPAGVANDKPIFNDINTLMAQIVVNQALGLITTIVFITDTDDIVLSSTLNFKNCILMASAFEHNVVIPDGCFVRNPLELKNISLDIRHGGQLLYNDSTMANHYFSNVISVCNDLVANEPRISFITDSSIIFKDCWINMNDNTPQYRSIHCQQGTIQSTYAYNTAIRNAFYFDATGQNFFDWYFDSMTRILGVIADYKVVPNVNNVNINLINRSELTAYDDTRVPPILVADNVQDAIDKIKVKGVQLSTRVFVDSTITATSPPVYKTLAETVALTVASPHLSYEVVIMSPLTIDSVIDYAGTGTTVTGGTADQVHLTFNSNGVINNVKEFNNFLMVFDATANATSVFNNTSKIYKFSDCKLVGGINKAVTVFIMFGYGELMTFQRCSLPPVLGVNKQWVAYTINGGNMTIVLDNTPLPETAEFTFNNTGTAATLNVYVIGLQTTKSSIAANCLSYMGSTINTVNYDMLGNIANVNITAPNASNALMYDVGTSKWVNRKPVLVDNADVTLPSVADGMALTYSLAATNTFTATHTSEEACSYQFYWSASPPDPTPIVPAGHIMFLDIFGAYTKKANLATTVHISFYNANTQNIYSSDYLNDINVGGNKFGLLIRGIIDQQLYLDASITSTVEDAINDQWIVTILNGTTNTEDFTVEGGICVKLKNYPYLDKQLDVNITAPSDGQLLAYNLGDQAWENIPPPVSATTLASLTDVSLASFDSLAYLAFNSSFLSTYTDISHQWRPVDIISSPFSWDANTGGGILGIKNGVFNSPAYNGAPSMNWTDNVGHASFDLGSTFSLASSFTFYMVYYKPTNVQGYARLLHFGDNPNFIDDFISPTQLVLLQNSYTDIKVQYRQDLNPSDLSFTPTFPYASFVNNGLNIMILRYDNATTTLSVSINGVYYTITNDFSPVNFRYFGFCGGVTGNFENTPSPGWSLNNNILECGFGNYMNDVTAGSMYSSLSSFYNDLANFGTANNSVLKYNSTTLLWGADADNDHTHTLNASLTDVVVAPSAGDVLAWNGVEWVNRNLSGFVAMSTGDVVIATGLGNIDIPVIALPYSSDWTAELDGITLTYTGTIPRRFVFDVRVVFQNTGSVASSMTCDIQMKPPLSTYVGYGIATNSFAASAYGNDTFSMIHPTDNFTSGTQVKFTAMGLSDQMTIKTFKVQCYAIN